MAYSVREERQSLATSLREDLAEAERLIVQLRGTTLNRSCNSWTELKTASHNWIPAVWICARSRRAGAVCIASCGTRPVS